MALVATLPEFKAWLRITASADDARLTDVLTSASEWVEWKLGGPLAVTQFTEVEKVHGYAYIPKKRPLVSVVSVTPELGAALDSSRYVADTTHNMIRFRWGVFAGWYTFAYTAGLSAIPYRAKNAGLELGRHLWLTQNGSTGRGRSDDDIPVPMGFAVPRRVDELLMTMSVPGFA